MTEQGAVKGPGPRSFGSIIVEMFRQYLGNVLPLTLIAAIVSVPLVAAGVMAFGPDFMTSVAGVAPDGSSLASDRQLWAMLVYVLLYMLGFLALSGAVATYVAGSLAGRPMSIGQAYNASLRRLPSMLGASFFAGLVAGLPLSLALVLAGSTGSFAGYFLLALVVFIAVYLLLRLMFALFVALLEQQPTIGAIARSWGLVSGALQRTFGLLLAIGLLVGLLQFGLQSVGTPLPGLDALLVSVIVVPLTVVGDLLIYLDLRARKETYGAEHLAAELDALAAAP